MARLYTNENFPKASADALKLMGHDVLTTQEAGNGGISMPDEDVLEYSRKAGRILITMNRKHFIRLHNEGRQHLGLIVCKFDPDFDGMARKIDTILKTNPVSSGMLFRVNRG